MTDIEVINTLNSLLISTKGDKEKEALQEAINRFLRRYIPSLIECPRCGYHFPSQLSDVKFNIDFIIYTFTCPLCGKEHEWRY